MSERYRVCVLCRGNIAASDSRRTETAADEMAVEQRCPSCGWFIAEIPAICILNNAVADGVRTRQIVIERYRRLIAAENRYGKPAIVTEDDAQAYFYGSPN